MFSGKHELESTTPRTWLKLHRLKFCLFTKLCHFLNIKNRNIQENNSLISKEGQHYLFPFFSVGFSMLLRCKQIQKHSRPSRFCYREKIEKRHSKFWEDGLLWRRFPQMNMRSWKLWRQYPERSGPDEIPLGCLSSLINFERYDFNTRTDPV